MKKDISLTDRKTMIIYNKNNKNRYKMLFNFKMYKEDGGKLTLQQILRGIK